MDAAEGPETPIRLFYSYSHRDEELRKKLEDHLAALRWSGMIAEWHDRNIDVGDEWAKEIDRNLSSADIILLLVSASFIASAYCWSVEMKKALERHDKGEAKVIPVILRPCSWHITPFAKLQAAPTDAKPVTSWSDMDAALCDVAGKIEHAVTDLQQQHAAKQVEEARKRQAAETSPQMILDPAKPAAASTASIKDGDARGFADDVIKASMTTPVMVDFWAPWCGPCETLTPLLERLVQHTAGRVRLVKIDIDRNRELAAPLRIQSVPTVYAFVGGQPVDAFVGAQPESKVRTFIECVIEESKTDRLPQLPGDWDNDLPHKRRGSQEGTDDGRAPVPDGTSESRKGPLTPTPRLRERVRVTRREPSQDFIKEIGEFLGFGGAREVKADDLKANVEKLKLPVEGLDVKVDGDKVTVFGKTPSQEIKEKVILALGNVPGVAKVEDHMDTPPGEQAAFYTVQKGDTLSAIAKKQYGDANKYNAIFEANKPMLSHPDKIYPGLVLRIPKLEATGPQGLGGGAND